MSVDDVHREVITAGAATLVLAWAVVAGVCAHSQYQGKCQQKADNQTAQIQVPFVGLMVVAFHNYFSLRIYTHINRLPITVHQTYLFISKRYHSKQVYITTARKSSRAARQAADKVIFDHFMYFA